MASIFTRIVNGDIPCWRVAESDNCFAFLDINPLSKGHTIVIPKKEVDYIFDLGDDLYNDLFAFAKNVAVALKESIPCKRVGVAVIGMEVPHAHIHLIPINSESDMDFRKKRVVLSKEEFADIAESILKSYQK